MNEEQILLGIGLTVVLAVGSQILASRLRVPSLIILLPAGFTAGALTGLVHPDQLAPSRARRRLPRSSPRAMPAIALCSGPTTIAATIRIWEFDMTPAEPMSPAITRNR
ncbi:hypothetical protein SUDANB105_07579 [Streptomyces sp. enrichment culture]|uniref:hypothetical protein n=1 Tax=Streptomyces sp. enrichment culture TaxID=1795815 RepID=UPI003F57349B